MFNLFKNDNIKSVNVNDMDSLIGKVNLIDIREPYEFKGGSLKGAKNIPMGTLLEHPERYLDKNNSNYIMCQSGGRSKRTCSLLSKQGFDVVNVAGGMGSYAGTKRS